MIRDSWPDYYKFWNSYSYEDSSVLLCIRLLRFTWVRRPPVTQPDTPNLVHLILDHLRNACGPEGWYGLPKHFVEQHLTVLGAASRLSAELGSTIDPSISCKLRLSFHGSILFCIPCSHHPNLEIWIRVSESVSQSLCVGLSWYAAFLFLSESTQSCIRIKIKVLSLRIQIQFVQSFRSV